MIVLFKTQINSPIPNILNVMLTVAQDHSKFKLFLQHAIYVKPTGVYGDGGRITRA